MEIDEEKINYYKKRGYIDIDDNAKFKYIVEILRLFNINVNGWMKGSYILNDNEGIMFTTANTMNWTDKIDDEYMYERCDTYIGNQIAEWNEYWGNKTIYLFRKEKNDAYVGYKFMGCFRQDREKIKELFSKGIIDERPYKKIGSRIDLTKF